MKENRKEKKKENLWLAGAWRVSRGVAAAGSVGGANGSGEGKKDENGDLLSDRIEGDFLTW